MAKSDVDRVTEEKVARGGVLVKFYFDMQHKDKEQLQPLMTDLINNRLMKEKGVVYCYGAIEEPLQQKDVYTTSAVVTVLFENFMSIINIAFNYAPAGIEIIKPTKDMSFRIGELQNMLMDMSQLSAAYSRFILERVLKPDEIEAMNKSLMNRAEIGKRFLEKRDTEKKDGGA